MRTLQTLGETAIEFIINHAETRVVIVQADRLQRLADTLPTINTKLLAVVYWGEPPETAIKVSAANLPAEAVQPSLIAHAA